MTYTPQGVKSLDQAAVLERHWQWIGELCLFQSPSMEFDDISIK